MKIADMHCDTILEIRDGQNRGEEIGLRENRLHLDLKRMKDCGYLLQNFALFVDSGMVEDPWEEMVDLCSVYKNEMEKSKDMIAPVLRYEDILTNERKGLMSSLLTIEEGAALKGDMSNLEKVYDMGVRMITLTWNYNNEIAFPNVNLTECSRETHPNLGYVAEMQRGLTAFGKDAVANMQDMGIIVDVSHLGDAGFYDVLDCTRNPFVASHSNARQICGHVRNMTDDMIRKLADRGGVTGLNFCPAFMETLPEGAKPNASLDAVVRHSLHITNVGGMECLGIGSDFDGISQNDALKGVQDMPALWDAMKKGGFTESQLDRIFYKNVLRLYKDCLE